MRRISVFFLLSILVLSRCVFAQSGAGTAVPQVVKPDSVQPEKEAVKKIILLISEQNIEGPQHAWWASEVDLSTVESTIAAQLLSEKLEVIEPSFVQQIIEKKPAFRAVALPEKEIVQLGNLSGAQFVIVGKAVASAGGMVPQSTMRSCYANINAKVIRVSDGRVVAYLDAAGSSAHPDAISGGKEALTKAARDLGVKITDALKKGGSGL